MTRFVSIAAGILSFAAFASESWELRMVLDVPRVYDNSASLGCRAYEHQRIQAFFTVDATCDSEPTITFTAATNLTHSVGCCPVTYGIETDEVLWHGIGCNANGKFPVRSVTLRIVAEPSYAVGPVATEDNSLLLTISGRGDDNRLMGYVAGQIGCGCREYGHVSPTRIWGTDVVVDTASVYGKWQAMRR